MKLLPLILFLSGCGAELPHGPVHIPVDPPQLTNREVFFINLTNSKLVGNWTGPLTDFTKTISIAANGTITGTGCVYTGGVTGKSTDMDPAFLETGSVKIHISSSSGTGCMSTGEHACNYGVHIDQTYGEVLSFICDDWANTVTYDKL